MRDRPRLRWFLVTWVLLTAISSLWALATPIGGAPDEPAHMVKAASVVRGQLLEPNTELGSVVQVPRYVAFTQAITCFAFQPEVTPACSPVLSGDPSEIVPAHTTAGLYNPVYYALVGWPTLLFGDVAGLYAMRIVSALLTSAFLAIAIAQLAAGARRAIPLLAAAAAVTPMLLFLDGTVNPNALESTATLATFVTMLAVIRQPDARLLAPRAAIIAVAASLAVNMRGISPLWVAIALFAPFLLASRADLAALFRSTAVRIAVGVVGLATAGALAWLAISNSLGSGVDFADGLLGAPDVGMSPLAGFLLVLFGTFSYAQGLIGVFGWLDTPSPTAVFFVWSAFIGILLLLGLCVPRGRVRVLALSLVVAAVLLPPIIQGAYIAQGGLIWQGRYLLPLFLCMVIALGIALSDGMAPPARHILTPLTISVLTAWAACQVYAYVTAVRRYGVGLTGELSDLVRDPDWSPPGGALLLSVAVTIVIVIAAALLARAIIGRASSATEAGVVGAESVDAISAESRA